VTGTVEVIGSPAAGIVTVFAGGSGGTQIVPATQSKYSEGATDMFFSYAINHLHSPATASAITYTVMIRRNLGGGSFIIQPSGDPSNITLMEVSS
jgi:hypothetical protein